MTIYSRINPAKSAFVLLSITAYCWISCSSIARSQNTYVYPDAYYGRGSTVNGDYLRGQAAVIHAYGAQYYAASMLAQQRAAMVASQQSHYQQQSVLASQAATYQDAMKRIERLEERIEELIQENAQLRGNLKTPAETDPAKVQDSPIKQDAGQLVKVPAANSPIKLSNRRIRR